ncbi:MAG: hypothetical protein WCP85_03375 [Mariniphaga sp.]
METTNEKGNIDLTRVRLTPRLIEMLSEFQTYGHSPEKELVDADFNNSIGKAYLDDINDIICFLVSLDAEDNFDGPEYLLKMMGKLYWLKNFLEALKAPETNQF